METVKRRPGTGPPEERVPVVEFGPTIGGSRVASSPDAPSARQGPPGHGRWTAGPLLGQGRLGRLFLAHDGTGRLAALRVVHARLARDQGFRALFAHEVQALGAVRGRRVAALVDADPHGTVPWLATEYVPGPTLVARVRDLGGPLGTPALRTLAHALAGALDEIHRAGLVHGDLRPSNVLLAAGGPRVVDFGMAGSAELSAGAGGPGHEGRSGYTAPELLAGPGGDVRPPADVFSLGAVLAFAAAGRGPFDAGGLQQDGGLQDGGFGAGGLQQDGGFRAGGLRAGGFRAGGEGPDLTGVPEELLPLVTACLARHPAARPAPRTVARMAGLPLPGSRRRALTLAGTVTLEGALLLPQLAAAARPLGGRWVSRTVER